MSPEILFSTNTYQLKRKLSIHFVMLNDDIMDEFANTKTNYFVTLILHYVL